jgi:hypothetical protein
MGELMSENADPTKFRIDDLPLCWFDAMMFHLMIELEKGNRWGRIISRFAQHKNIPNGKDLWTAMTGLPSAMSKEKFKLPLTTKKEIASKPEEKSEQTTQ